MRLYYNLWAIIHLQMNGLAVKVSYHNNNFLMPMGQIQDFPKGGRGLSGVWIFHTWTFCSGIYHTVHGQNVSRQNTGDKTPVKITRGHKMLSILWDREGKMPILSKDFIYDTDGQVN